jgi:glycosyltransferase involved in cell wall biosynthesis
MMKKRMLIIGPGMEIGGVERSLLGLMDSIDYGEYEVDLFLLSHTGEFMPLINENVNLLPENKLFSLVSWPIAKLIRSGHLYMAAIRIWSKLYGAMRARIMKTESLNITLCKKIVSKKVARLEGTYDIALGFFAPHYFLDEKVNARVKVGWVHTDYSNVTEMPDVRFTLPMWDGVDYIACVSKQVKASFDSVYPTLKNKTIVVENILSAEFVRKQADCFSVEREMLNDGNIKILSVGRFCTAKAFDEAVVACSLLIQRGYLIKWYLIGYGPDEQLIYSKIKEYHMENYVIVLGKKSNPYPYIQACDIYAQPSRYEGKAVTVIEAQILNKPVMITRYATSASQVREGIDGFICEMGAEGIARGLSYLIEHPEVCSLLAQNTRNYNYGNENETEKLLKLIS